MPVPVDVLEYVGTITLDHYIRNDLPQAQILQDQPLLQAMKAAQKTFRSGKENIVENVKDKYETYMKGYTGDDVVTFKNPTNAKQAKVPWKEISGGLEITYSELKAQGIHITDPKGSMDQTSVTPDEKDIINKMLADKMDDFGEGVLRDMNNYFWGDGTGDAKGPYGIRNFILDDPTTGTIAGIDAATNSFWRNRAKVGTAGLEPNKISETLNSELRQLRRYGGRPDLFMAGSEFLDALESELRAKGYYTQTGWGAQGGIEIGAENPKLKGTQIIYDPTMDDNGLSDYLYVVDTRHLFPYVMTGEDMKQHSPTRPHDKYVVYKAVTWTGNMFCNKRNCHGVYQLKQTP